MLGVVMAWGLDFPNGKFCLILALKHLKYWVYLPSGLFSSYFYACLKNVYREAQKWRNKTLNIEEGLYQDRDAHQINTS